MRALTIAYARDGVLFDYDPELSLHWEQQARLPAALQVEIPLIETPLASNWERELQEVRERHSRAEAGDADAQLAIGREILQQAGTDTPLINKAYGWIERAAQTGFVDAQLQLANYYLGAEPASASDLEQGRRWLLAAADAGHERALRKAITACKEAAYGLPRDLQRAKAYSEDLFKVLKARGVLENESDWLTASWEYSDTLKQIKSEAERYLPPDELKRQSDAGDPAAMYYQGKDLRSTRFDEGTALMKASAEAGYPQAQYEMARSYRTRKRTEEEERQAVDWLAAAVRSGHRGAMVDLGIVYLQGIKRIGLERNPYRARLLFEQALRGSGDTVYEQKTGNGRSWIYTVEIVNHWLDRIPEPVKRLDLKDLEGALRQAAIEQWYRQERQALESQSAQGDAFALQKQLEQLEQQRSVLLNEKGKI